MKNAYIFFAFMLLAIISLIAFAGATQVTITPQASGLDVRAPGLDTLKFGQTFDFPVHVFNASNGVPMYSGLICYFHLYNSSGEHVVTLSDSSPSNDFDYEFSVNKSNHNFTLGYYFANIQCNNSLIGGGVRYDFQVTQSGFPNSELSSRWTSLAIIIFFVVAILFFLLFVIFKDDYMKWFSFTIFFLFLVMGINIVNIAVSNETTIPQMISIYDTFASASYYALWFVFGLMFILFIYKMIFDAMFKKNLRDAERFGGSPAFTDKTYL